jgi:hypothetical protein
MTFVAFVIAGGVLVGAVGLAALYDYRVRRRGGSTGGSTPENSDNPRNVQAAVDPTRQDRLGGGL